MKLIEKYEKDESKEYFQFIPCNMAYIFRLKQMNKKQQKINELNLDKQYYQAMNRILGNEEKENK